MQQPSCDMAGSQREETPHPAATEWEPESQREDSPHTAVPCSPAGMRIRKPTKQP